MADKTTGGLKAVEEVSIGDLPGIVDLYDDSLIPVEQQGEARHMTGRQWRKYAEAGVMGSVDDAQKAAEEAKKSEVAANAAAGTATTNAEAAEASTEEAKKAEKGAEEARKAIEDMTVTSESLSPDEHATVTKTLKNGVFNLDFGIPKGEPGADGTSFVVRGLYSTLDELTAAHPAGSEGEAWAVGSQEANVVYLWDVDAGEWKNVGSLQGPPGQPGQPGEPGAPGEPGKGIPAGGAVGQIPAKKSEADFDVEWKDPPEGVGRSMAGKTVEPTQGTTVTAGAGAEIFNDYRVREFWPTGYIKCGNVASGEYSNAEGSGTTASGENAHAEGYRTTASGESAHAEGFSTTASAQGAHAEGLFSEAKGDQSHAGGNSTIAAASAQTAIGSYNIERSDFKDTFIIGKGSTGSRANCFRVTHTGVYASGNYNASGADYAELFEWADGNPEASDRAGRFVTLTGGKIRLAGPGDGYILGLVSGNPSVVGDVYDDQWQGMYLTDIFGRPLWEDVEVPAVTEEVELPVDIPGGDSEPRRMELRKETRVIIPAHTERRQKLNPDYDPTQAYVPRSQRPEWAAVGMLGKLVALEDGTCRVDGWAAVGEGGVAVGSEERTKYRVMEKLTDPETGRKCVRILIM